MLAQELHFARAAEQLGVSAPTLTEQMQSLERKLGAQLLDRSARSVTLTSVGKSFLAEAEATLRQADRAKLVAQGFARGTSGKLEIGYLLIASLIGLVPTIVGRFRRENPSIDIVLHRSEMIPQQQAIVAGALDVGFVKTPVQYPGALSGFVVTELPYAAVFPIGHKLSSRSEIDTAELENEDFIGMSVEVEVAFWGNISLVTKRTEPRIVKRTDDILSLLNLVAAGYGISIVTYQLSRMNVPGVVFVPIRTKARNSISMIYRRNDQTPALTGLKAFVKANTSMLSL